MTYEDLKERIKLHEGFRNYVYLDSLGKRTVGYGHLCRDEEQWDIKKTYSQEELDLCFENDFGHAVNQAADLIGNLKLKPEAKEVIIEMVFQLGKTGVSKFKKMWTAFGNYDYNEAANQMLDSKWAKQTPERAKDLSDVIKNLV